MQAEVRDTHSSAPLAEEQAIAAIYTQNPEPQAEFGKYLIHTKHAGDNVVVLVCSSDGKIGLLEDASWTLKVDRIWAKTEPKHPCAWDPSLEPSGMH